MTNPKLSVATATKFYQDNIRLIKSYNNESIIEEVLKLDVEVLLMFFVRYKNGFKNGFEALVAEKFKNEASTEIISCFVDNIRGSKTSLIFKDRLLKEATCAEMLKTFVYCKIPFEIVFDKVMAENNVNNMLVLLREYSWKPLVKANLESIESLILASDNKDVKKSYSLVAKDFYVVLKHFQDTYTIDDVVDLVESYYESKLEEVREECEDRIKMIVNKYEDKLEMLTEECEKKVEMVTEECEKKVEMVTEECEDRIENMKKESFY